MILFFLCLAEIYHIGNLKLHNGREIFHSKPHLLSSNENGWYYVNIINSSKIDSLLQIGVQISTKSFMNPQWICAYLNSTQIEEVSKLFFISEVLPSDKISNEKQLLESSKYLIYAHESFNPSPNYRIQKIYKNYYVSKSYSPQLLEDRSILQISPYESPQLLNRFSRGTTQQEKFKVEFNGSLLIPDLPMYKHGITGSGQVVTIIDSGLDYRSCFFKDLQHDPPVNITNFNHRKIIRYEPYADSSDASHGHGTHVSGTVAGNADCQQCSTDNGCDSYSEQCAMSLYNGHAPGAKIYFIDAGYVQRPNDLDAEYDMEDVIQMSRFFGGHIFSCSWGYPPTQNEKVRIMYDEIGYNNPDFIFFFGAGNSRRSFDVYAPANSKNIMGVGGVDKPSAFSAFSKVNNYVYLELKKSKKRSVCNFSDNNNLFITRTTNDPLVNFTNQIIGENFILVKSEKECAKIDAEYSTKSLFITADNNINCEAFRNVPRCLIDSQFIDQIQNGLEASLVIDFESEEYGVSYGISGFTSTGPSSVGLVKPDIFTPGSEIVSAAGNTYTSAPPGCSIGSGTRTKSGTSMATPAAAGATALLAQYIEDGFYPYGRRSNLANLRSISQDKKITEISSQIINENNDLINKLSHNDGGSFTSNNNPKNTNVALNDNNGHLIVTMPLLKALITNSAGIVKESSTIPDCSKGYGVMHVADILPFSDETEKMKEFGLRISSQDFLLTGKSKEEYVSEIKLLSDTSLNKPLVVTLAWLDPPTSAEREKLPIYADLDLFIECPDGTIVFGNQIPNNIEEMYSATERVTINNPKGGVYKIHVTCPKLAQPAQISPSIVVNGPFNHLDFSTNPEYLKFTKVNIDRTCPFYKTGHLCQHDVTKIETDYSVTFSLKYRTPKYFCTFFDGGEIQIIQSAGKGQKVMDIMISMNQVEKFGGEELYFASPSSSSKFVISENVVPTNTYIYITLCELVNSDVSNIKLEVQRTAPPAQTNSPTPSQSFATSSDQPISQSLSISPLPSQSISASPSQSITLSYNQSISSSPSRSISLSYSQLITIIPSPTVSSKSSKFKKKFVSVVLFSFIIYLLLSLFIYFRCRENQIGHNANAENQALEGLLAQRNDML